MALATYSDLKAKLSTYLVHQRWVADYDDCTRMFEASANRRLRVRQMETSTNLTTVSGAVALPADYLTWRTVLWTGLSPMLELEYTHPAYLESTAVGTTGSNPQLFTIEGSSLKVRPVSDTVDGIQFHYYQKLSSLINPAGGSSDSRLNWLLTEHPDAYEFGVLVELAALSRNTEMAQLYKARRDEVLAEIVQLSAQTTGPTSPQVRTAEYF